MGALEQVVKSTFKRTDKDVEDDLRYFWSKTRALAKQLEDAGYVVNLKPTFVDVRKSKVK